jgi:hypothetical protein
MKTVAELQSTALGSPAKKAAAEGGGMKKADTEAPAQPKMEKE